MTNWNGTKKMRAAGVLVCGLMLAAIPALAQQDTAPPPPPAQGETQGPPGGHRGGMNIDRQLEMMTRTLNLTTDQQASIKQILTDQRAKMESQQASMQSMSPEDRRAAMMAMRETQNSKIEAVLTPDQKTKYEAMMAQRRERMKDQRNGGAPPPPPPQ